MQSSSRYTRRHQALVSEHAAHMHSALTASEVALWAHLRGGQLGVWFGRQMVVGRFVADFAAASARLVVEVDGNTHLAVARPMRGAIALSPGSDGVSCACRRRSVLQRPLEAVALVRAATAG
jgi:very-short-patch-repair endonuclease